MFGIVGTPQLDQELSIHKKGATLLHRLSGNSILPDDVLKFKKEWSTFLLLFTWEDNEGKSRELIIPRTWDIFNKLNPQETPGAERK